MPIITIKTLQQQQFNLDVDMNDTIGRVKEKIQAQEKHDVSWQKLIHAGKILDDSATLASSNITVTDFLVLMVRKPRDAPTPTGAPAAQTPAISKPAETAPAVSTSVSSPSTTSAAAVAKPAETPSISKPTTTATPATPSSASSLVTGSAYEQSVQQLMDMGFGRDEIVRALRAAFNNPDRAVEYLTTGIPASDMDLGAPVPVATPQASASPSATPAQPSTGSTSGGGMSLPASLIPPQLLGQQQGGGGGGGGTFDFLRSHPQFNQLKQLVQTNPTLLQPVLTQLGQQNPQILQLINTHQQEFIQLLNEPVTTGGGGGMGGLGGLMGAMGGMGGMGAMGGGGGGGGGAPGPHYIQVTAEEKAAIDRLETLGFERSQVIEAFLACDKDEQVAANYLLEHLGDVDEDDDGAQQ